MKFPYEEFPLIDIPLPTLNIEVINPKSKQLASVEYKVLVDSGAAGCIFHTYIAKQLEIDVDSGRKGSFIGATGKESYEYLHPVTLVIGGIKVDLEVGFSYELHAPFGLLGQKGFFEKYRVCFDLPVGDFEIVPKTRKK